MNEFAAALLDPGLPCPGAVRAWNGSDPLRRFNVHRNNVASSLAAALADTFPVVQELVGREFFRAMAGVFVREHPPASPVLVRYGERFPAFIGGFAPAASVPYLADVARLEFARLESLHAADAPSLPAEDLAAALQAGERAGELQIALHPSLRLVGAQFAAISIWAAHQGAGELAEVAVSRPEWALVVRPGLEVLVIPCDRGTFEFARGLQRGCDFGDSAALGAAAAAGFDLSSALQVLIGHGAIASIVNPGENAP